MKHPLSSFIILLSSFALLFAFGNAASAQWIIDGQQTQVLKLEVTDPQAARTDGSNIGTNAAAFRVALSAAQNYGTNSVYHTTNAVARWVALTNGIALEINSSTGWVRQVEWRED